LSVVDFGVQGWNPCVGATPPHPLTPKNWLDKALVDNLVLSIPVWVSLILRWSESNLLLA